MKTLPEYIWSKIEIAQQLRNIMFQKCLSQQKVADEAGIGIAHFNSILCAKVLPRFDTLINLVESMGCTVEIRIVPKQPNDKIRFKKLAQSYWQCEFGKFTPEELKLLRQYYMVSLEDEDDQMAA